MSTKWNVINEKDFKERVNRVFECVSGALTNTLGPYGSTTIIEKYGEMHITKDGWQVLKNIRFDDPIDNNIMMLLIRISAQVVAKVGDGSTSSIIAANSILKEIGDKFATVRSKDFISILSNCVSEITKVIYANSTKADKKYNCVYNLAKVSTNGDDYIAGIIRDIYQETNNPTIEYLQSKTDKTFFEIISGYKLERASYLDTIFATNENGDCIVYNPYILLFDHKVDLEHSLPIISEAVQKAIDDKTRLIVFAPNYDKFFLDHIKKQIAIEYRANGTSSIIYCRVSLINNMSHNLYNDFSVMCGAQIITEQYSDDTQEFDKEHVSEYMGKVSEAIIGDKDTLIKGFVARNSNMYNKIVLDAETKYHNMEEEYREKGLIDMKLTEAKNRVSRLKGKMGIIHVGGYSTLEKAANYDLVEDAVKACESAVMHGYNIGQNLAIPMAINKIIDKSEIIDKESLIMYRCISDAFKNVFATIIRNKHADCPDKSIDTTYKECLDRNKAFDLTNDSYSENILNSCITDIEILKAAASIIALLVSSNQYISINTPNEIEDIKSNM